MTTDLTDRYHSSQYMRGGPAAWAIDRNVEPVKALMIHHTAGFYGPTLGVGATQEQEIAQLDALARDHMARFGIGPGYYYAGFPSGRLYAIGKYGTHRAHTKGRNIQTGNLWNRESLAIVAFGDYEANPMSGPLKAALGAGITEVKGFAGPVPVYPHGETPGNPTSTSCPGRHIKAWLKGTIITPPHDHTEALKLVEHAQADLDKVKALLGGD